MCFKISFLSNFDCFIRADANLALAAEKIGDFKVVISPKHHRWDGFNLIIDLVDIRRHRDESEG